MGEEKNNVVLQSKTNLYSEGGGEKNSITKSKMNLISQGMGKIKMLKNQK